jgi:hypothetical protein
MSGCEALLNDLQLPLVCKFLSRDKISASDFLLTVSSEPDSGRDFGGDLGAILGNLTLFSVKSEILLVFDSLESVFDSFFLKIGFSIDFGVLLLVSRFLESRFLES